MKCTLAIECLTIGPPKSIPWDKLSERDKEQARIAAIAGQSRFFWVDEIIDYIDNEFFAQAIDHLKDGLFDEYLFLPAPSCIFEFKPIEGGQGFFNVIQDGEWFWLTDVCKIEPEFAAANGAPGYSGMILKGDSYKYKLDSTNRALAIRNDEGRTMADLTEAERDSITRRMWYSLLLMVIINQKVVDVNQDKPTRQVARSMKRSGVDYDPADKFWTISLDSTPRKRQAGESEAEYSKRSLHYCRAHLRLLPQGRLVRVKGHWRGDAAMGTRQSEYAVKTPSL